MRSTRSYLFIALIVLLTGVAASAQQTFTDPAVNYSFEVPDGWRQSRKPTTTDPNVEFVYGDRTAGQMAVRMLPVTKDKLITDVIDEEGHLRLQMSLPGYVAGKEENFAGYLRGSVFNFEYANAGKPMSGRYYFLRANPTTVYVLQFRGPKDGLQRLRNQTDMFARTFKVK